MKRLLALVFAGQRKSGQLDLEAIEMAVRGAMHRAGAAALGQLLSLESTPVPSHACDCGGELRLHSFRQRHLLSALGPLDYTRAYYLCPHCHQGHSPRDRELGVEGTAYSPGVRRMMAVVGSEASFQQGREQLALLAGLEVTSKAVERQAEAIGAAIEAAEQAEIRCAKQLELPVVCAPAVPILYIEMDGTGVPVVKAECVGHAGKTEGQPARTREVKHGCVFTQSGRDEKGRPMRDEASTTYVAAIESAEDFGLRLYTEAWRRGWQRARKKVVIGDGALWIWNLADQHFPGALQIVDLYHARQHLWELAPKLFPDDLAARKRWLAPTLDCLEKGKIEALGKLLRQTRPPSAEAERALHNDAEYFQRNAARMRYPSFRAQGLFVGSGVVEAGCKEVIGSRLKRSGMFWSVEGANAILALRCCRLSGRFEDYWESQNEAA